MNLWSTEGKRPHIPEKFANIPVEWVRDGEFIARATGICKEKTIQVGRRFRDLKQEFWTGILAHEAAHCHLFHVEHRILTAGIFTLLTMLASSFGVLGSILVGILGITIFATLCRSQENEADLFAADIGAGKELIEFLRFCVHEPRSLFRPHVTARIVNLTTYIESHSLNSDCANESSAGGTNEISKSE